MTCTWKEGPPYPTQQQQLNQAAFLLDLTKQFPWAMSEQVHCACKAQLETICVVQARRRHRRTRKT